jgi:hypothetical protein
MFKKNLFRHVLLLGVVVLLLALTVSIAFAQSSTSAVSIRATDPTAKEPADNGEFTVYRSSNSTTTAALTVYYSISGTATNGKDYATLSNSVVIPAGAFSAPIPVKVIDDLLKEGVETVTATIIPYCPGPLPCTYNIAPPPANSATVSLYDND